MTSDLVTSDLVTNDLVTNDRCNAAWCMEHGAGIWPSGDWRRCHNDASDIRFVPIGEDCLAMVFLCEAHGTIYDESGRLVKFVRDDTDMLGINP